MAVQVVDTTRKVPEPTCAAEKKKEGWTAASTGPGWNIEIPAVDTCGRTKDKFEIILSNKARSQIYALLFAYKGKEWLAYLIGKLEDIGTLRAANLIVPDQVVSSTDVESVAVPPEGVIGVIHSHHSMGSFFSGTDKQFVNVNNGCSVVVSLEKGAAIYTAKVRTKTPCGFFVTCDAVVLYAIENVAGWLEESKKHIAERVYAQQQIPGVCVGVGHYPKLLGADEEIVEVVDPVTGKKTIHYDPNKMTLKQAQEIMRRTHREPFHPRR